MKDEKFVIRKHEDYEMWTTTNDNGKTFGRITVDFKPIVSIHLNNEDIIFHNCKKIVSDKERTELSFYDKDDNEIVGTIMNINIDYEINRNGYEKNLPLRDFRYKKGLREFLTENLYEFKNTGGFVDESEALSFCQYFDIYTYDSYEDMGDRLQDLHYFNDEVMDYVAVDLLAEDSGFDMINDDGLWIDNESLEDFKNSLHFDFEGDFSKALHQFRKDCQ